MSAAIFGNIWHGQLSDTSLTLADLTELTSVSGNNSSGGTTTFDYIPPAFDETLGHTYYYKQPGIATASTPAVVSAAGGEFMNDAILFGSFQRYSPFGGGSMLGRNKWLHFGADGKWRKMSLATISVGDGTAPSVRVNLHEQFGVINKEIEAETTALADFSLSGKLVSSPSISDIDVRRDGRQIIFHLLGFWTNEIDNNTGYIPFDNYNYKAIAATWSIEISDDFSSVTATRVWLAEAIDYVGTFDRTWWEPNGDLYLEGGKYYQPVIGIKQGQFDGIFLLERLVGAGFDAAGTLHLVKYSYRTDLIGVWTVVAGDADQGYTPTPFVARASPDPTWKNDQSDILEYHPTTVSYSIEIESNSSVLKTISSQVDPPPYAVVKTNNTSDLRQPSLSLCRVGPGCIDDSTVAGSGSSLFVAFNPRAGTVHTSSAPIGFV